MRAVGEVVIKKGERCEVSKEVLFMLPEPLVKAVDELVDKGYFRSRSEAIRAGLYVLLALIHYGVALPPPKGTLEEREREIALALRRYAVEVEGRFA